jgi:hypothetical protein
MLLLAAALPVLFWSGGPETAPALREAGIERIAVPAAQAAGWGAGLSVEVFDPAKAVKLATPAVEYRPNEATASRSPWLDANGWALLRKPAARYYYDAPGPAAALAAAEAFSYGANAVVHTDAAGLQAFAGMLRFLRSIETLNLSPAADIGFLDDGGDVAGEVLNLMLRNNLLVSIVPKPDARLKLNVRLGSREFPMADAQDPSAMAHMVRGRLTDEKRSLRIYGTQVVLARVLRGSGRLRVVLVNYDGARRTVDGLRVRVLGSFPNHRAAAAGNSTVQLLDYAVDRAATEFTVPTLATIAVIDLSK